MDEEAFIEIGQRKIRLGADSMEEDIDKFFDAVIEELVIPVVKRIDSPAGISSCGEPFWDTVFGKIAEMVEDLPAAERKLILRALVGVETYRRFQKLLDETQPAGE